MEPIASHENWRNCFSEVAPGLLLFARQWVQSAADAEDIVQEAFVKFWRRNHDIDNRGLLYAAVRSLALDFIRRDARRARREATVLAETDRVAFRVAIPSTLSGNHTSRNFDVVRQWRLPLPALHAGNAAERELQPGGRVCDR